MTIDNPDRLFFFRQHTLIYLIVLDALVRPLILQERPCDLLSTLAGGTIEVVKTSSCGASMNWYLCNHIILQRNVKSDHNPK